MRVKEALSRLRAAIDELTSLIEEFISVVADAFSSATEAVLSALTTNVYTYSLGEGSAPSVARKEILPILRVRHESLV